MLGPWLVHALLNQGYRKIFVLARAKGKTSAENRVSEALKFCRNGREIRGADKTVQVVCGDICEPNLGLSLQLRNDLLRQITDIFHTAARTDLNAPLNALRLPNVVGAENVFRLALHGSQLNGHTIRVHHVSSVTVAGNLQGWFSESQFSCSQRFHNAYEQTKFEAEQLALEYRNKGLNVAIYRPGIITGDSVRGTTSGFKVIYQPLRFLAHNLFNEWPAREDAPLSLVPVDKVAEALCLLSWVEYPLRGAWHLVNPEDTTLGKLIDVGIQVFGCHRPALIPAEHFNKSRFSLTQWRLIGPFVPYLNYRVRFSSSYTKEVLNKAGFKWPKMDSGMLGKLYRYCGNSGFIRPRSIVPARKTFSSIFGRTR